MEYVGEVLDVQTWESRLKVYKAENRPLHCHVLNDHMVIDAGVKGNMARLINHSCEPNAKILFPFADHRCLAYALRDIAPGEQLTISYIRQSDPLEKRTKALKEYGFQCICQKCNRERAVLGGA